MNKTQRFLAAFFSAALIVLLIGIGFSQESAKKNDQTKFGKFVINKELYKQIEHYTGTSLVAHNGELQADISFGYHCLAKPISFDKPHSHNFQEILCFVGGNSLDITDFSAQIEYTIGDEKHILTQPGCVSMPPGQMHCPIRVTNVSKEKPIVFIEMSLSRTYGKPAAKGEVKP